MSMTTQATANRLADPMRKTALIGGLFYLLTFAASMPQLYLFEDVIEDHSYITGHGSDTTLRVGILLEILTAIACIGTAVALYPATKRVSRSAAIGFLSSRIVEATMIVVGTMSLLAVLTLRDRYPGGNGADPHTLNIVGQALVELRQWTFLLGPGIIPAFNAMLLGYIVYRARLVPRALPTIGFVGAPLILISAISTILGGWSQTSVTGSLFALPIAAWEFSLGIYLTFRGFAHSPEDFPNPVETKQRIPQPA